MEKSEYVINTKKSKRNDIWIEAILYIVVLVMCFSLVKLGCYCSSLSN